VLDRFRGTGLQNYLQSLKEGDVTVARKPQYVDQIPNQFDGNTRELLERTDERGALDSLIDRLNIRPVMDQPIDSISGGSSALPSRRVSPATPTSTSSTRSRRTSISASG